MKQIVVLSCCLAAAPAMLRAAPLPPPPAKKPDAVRAAELRRLKWGLFVCWSFSTFSGREWTPTRDKDASFFRATGCDPDQWCKTAREAGMGYILFLTKHHDGFCLWDTDTTDKKVTNSPLGIDVLAKLRNACDRYGLKLALYFSEGDWNWPGAVDGRAGKGGCNPAVKKAQLEELCTRYGPIEFFWMDHAVGDGGLSHAETVKWVHRFQPDTFVGFNNGAPAGRLAIRERGRPGPVGEPKPGGHRYLVAEFTYPILPPHQGGAQWFYSLPKHDTLCLPAEKIHRDYLGAVAYGNLFSLDVGPDYAGRLRAIDVRTLRKVGRYIRGELQPPAIRRGRATASSSWPDPAYSPQAAADGDPKTRWGAAPDARSAWLALDLGRPVRAAAAYVDEGRWNRVRAFDIQVRGKAGWRTVASGGAIGPDRRIPFERPVTGSVFRLNIRKAVDVPTLYEFGIIEEAAP